jgi:UDP-glucose 4-epimerase
MTVLVTGGTGFVGAYVVRHFAEQGERVVAYDLLPNPEVLKLIVSPQAQKQISVEVGDLLDLPNLLRVGRKHGVRRIAHLAYMITLPTRANPWLAQKVNIEGTNNVFELALERKANRIVWASTIDVFGPKSVSSDGVVANDAAYDPQGIYGACKMLNEIAARDLARDFGLDPICLRIPAAFGAGTTRSWGRFIPNMIKALVKDGQAAAPNLHKVMPWLYAADVAEAFARAFQAPQAAEPGYTLPGHVLGVDEVVEMVREMFPGAKIEPMEWPDFGTVPSYDGSKSEELLDWKPRFSVRDGLEQIAEIYRRAGRS